MCLCATRPYVEARDIENVSQECQSLCLRLLIAMISCLALLTPALAIPVRIEWVTVGDPGNSPDTTVESDGTRIYGSVPYEYHMGKYEVTTITRSFSMPLLRSSTTMSCTTREMGSHKNRWHCPAWS